MSLNLILKANLKSIFTSAPVVKNVYSIESNISIDSIDSSNEQTPDKVYLVT